jgi:heptosyltransferase-2
MADPSRIVVRAPNWLGDAVMALPAMAAIRRGLEGRTLIVAARASIAPIFHERTEAAPDEVLALDADRETEQLRGVGADAIVLLPNSFGSAWTARRARIAERWGFAGAGRGPLLTRRVARPRGRVHQVAYYNALARGLGYDVPEGALPRIEASDAARDKADALLDLPPEGGSSMSGIGGEGGRETRSSSRPPLVGFAPGAAYGHAKRWPPARVAQVIGRLSEMGVTSVLVGAKDDRDTSRAIESSLPQGARVIDLIGRTSLRELVGVMSRCAAFVSNDSGAMHVAAALGVPLTAIFGPTDDRVTSPAGKADILHREVFCRPCMLRECPIDHRCMKRIDADSVIQSVTGHLA